MSLNDRLRWATAPVQGRSTVLLWVGLTVFLASAGVLTGIDVPPAAGTLLFVVMAIGWVVGACGMIGYMRWYFRQSAAETRKLHDSPPKR